MRVPSQLGEKIVYWGLLGFAFASVTSVAGAQDANQIHGSYTLAVNSSGADCPPIIRAPFEVSATRGRKAAVRLQDQPGTASFYGGGLAFTARFDSFDMTGPVSASGEFTEYQGRTHVDINLRWPKGVDCTASLSGSKPNARAPAARQAAAPVSAPDPEPVPPPTTIGPTPAPSLAAAAPPAPAASAGMMGPLQPGQDVFDAGDYRSFPIASPDPQLCVAACQEEARCKAVAYTQPGTYGSPSASCWLKERSGRLGPNANAISSVKLMPATAASAGEADAEGERPSLWVSLLRILGVGLAGSLAGFGLVGLIRGRQQ
jgi:hypothetical protein